MNECMCEKPFITGRVLLLQLQLIYFLYHGTAASNHQTYSYLYTFAGGAFWKVVPFSMLISSSGMAAVMSFVS